MNHGQHEDFADCSGYLLGLSKEQRDALSKGAGEADYLPDVRCSVPFHGMFPGTWSALCHFEPGYRWNDDRSLGILEELGDAGLHLARSTVDGTSAPMLAACADQPGAVLSDFRFPSASQMGSYWSTAPFGSPECGRALHMVQDACCPHHAWGALLWGHQEFEDELETEWDRHRRMLKLSGSDVTFTGKVRSELAGISSATVGQLILSNAAWARDWFGQPHRLEECPWDSMLAVCIRAVASTMRAIQLMRGTA
jgi:hypothetical protein